MRTLGFVGAGFTAGAVLCWVAFFVGWPAASTELAGTAIVVASGMGAIGGALWARRRRHARDD